MRMLDIVPAAVALTGVCLLMLLLALALPVQAAENLPDLKDPVMPLARFPKTMPMAASSSRVFPGARHPISPAAAMKDGC